MSAATPDRALPASGTGEDWGEPSREARVRVEKSGLKVEVAVPSSQAPRLLDAAILAMVMGGVLFCPVATLRAVPVDFPVWATVCLVAGQIGLLGLISLTARRAFGSVRARRRG